METISEQKQELTIIDKSIEIFKGGGQVLLANQSKATKALQVADKILSDIEQAGGKMDEGLDARCNKFLVNSKAAVDQMEAGRKPITQLFDMIKKMFTEEEGKLDAKNPKNPGYKIQQFRNQYAKDVAAEQDRLRKEAEARAAKSHEANEIRGYIKNAISQKLLDFLAHKKRLITDSFNAITLDVYEEKSHSLKNMATVFPQNKLAEIFKYADPIYRIHDIDGYNAIRTEEHTAYDFQSFYNEYDRQIAELKQSLIDRLPAKKEELDQIAEQKRIQEENDKKLAEAKNEQEKQAAIERQKQIEENQRLLAEQQQKREEEDRIRLAKEEDQRKLEAEQKAAMEKESAAAQVMFDQVADTAAVMTPAPEVRNSYEITILSKPGIVELFQFWFTREATNLSIEEMSKKSISQMKAYAEGVAKKDDVKIESKNLRYNSVVKSVNRKIVS